jgi:hypothetical protein
MEPGKNDDLVSGMDALEGLKDPWLKDEPCIGCPLVPLFGGRRKIGQWRLNSSDRFDVESLFHQCPLLHEE